MRLRCMLVCAGVVLAALAPSSEARAQDGAAAASQPSAAVEPSVTAQPDIAPAPESAKDSPERAYHLAFLALADGDIALARSLLEHLASTHASDPLAAHAKDVLALLDAPHAAPATTPAAPAAPTSGAAPASDAERAPEDGERELRRERRPASARSELVFIQTAHGFALGAEVCAIVGCEDSRAWVAGLMLGAGTGFTASYLASRDGVEAGLARALTDGTLWGLAHGSMLLLATDATRGVGDETAIVNAHLAVGQLAGLGVAGLLYAQLEPTVGQVSATSSGGIWTLALTAQLLGAIDPDMDEQAWAGALLAASDLGLLAGGLFAAHHPMSPSRALMIDAGGLLGGLGGLGIGVLSQDDPQPTPTLLLGAVGTLTGLGLSYYFTRNWDLDDRGSNARLSLVPVAGGAMARAHVRF